VPAQINAKARQLLIDRHSVSGGSRTTASAVAKPAQRWGLIAAAVVGVLLIAVALWPRSAKHDGTGASSKSAESTAPVAENTVDLALPNVAPAPTSAAGTGAAPEEPAPAAAAAPLPVPTLGPEVEHPVPTSPTGKIAISSVPAPEAEPPPVPAGNVAGHPAAPAMTTVTIPVAPAPSAKAEVPPAVSAAAASPAAKPAAASTGAADKAKVPPAVKPKHVPKPAVTVSAATNPVTAETSGHDSPWLQNQHPDDYTLQIIGGQREASIRQFAAANRLEGQSAILKTARDGKVWYVLVYGAYPSRAAASQALAQLPAKVRAAKPWPRSIATVQADIAKKP
jgi:DamX protein